VRFLRWVLFSHGVASMLAVISFSEMLILNWLLLATGRPPLGWLGSALAVGLFALSNLGAILLLRAVATGLRAAYVASRIFMVGSLGALFSGPPLLVVFALFGTPLLLSGAGVPAALGNGALIGGGALALGLGFGSMLWGFAVGQRRLRVEEVEVPVRDLPEALHGLRIAHISDIHIGSQLGAPRLRRFLARVNEVEADLIAITGDIFDFDPTYIEAGCRELDKLSAPCGVFAILGNHDVYTGTSRVAAGIRSLTSIQLLRDEWARVRYRGASLYVLGVEDPGVRWADRDYECETLDALAAEAPRDAPRILLAHRPSYFRQAARLGLPLMLAGHTHGGQITLPGRARHFNISRMIAHWTRGRFEQGESILYVNRGLGVAGPPVRLNCPREIAVLTLVPRRG
jgi:predicted MPP superfamily phosphohydrolase